VPGTCARARVEAPSRWAAEPLSKKIALVPAATFQLWRACAARAAAQGPARCAPLPRVSDGGHSAPAPGAAARRELGGRAGELFAGKWGCLSSRTKHVERVRVAVDMPFLSTLAAAAGATDRLRGCTVARKIALPALSGTHHFFELLSSAPSVSPGSTRF
jgi:hypothetical protein